MHDPHVLLCVPRRATVEEIKRAFRRLAMQWHPDRNPTREAEDRFKQIKAAYELLLDPERLAEWEASCSNVPDVETSGPESAELILLLELEEAASGCVKTLTLASEQSCTECDGRGTIEQRFSVACSICKGVGRILAGQSNAMCSACNGRGYVRVTPCPACKGLGRTQSARQIEVKIPAGMQAGERLRLPRQHRMRDKPATDLFIKLDFYPHPFFTLDGKDLLCSVPVNLFRLLHGGSIDIPTLHGMREILIESYPRHGLEYKLPGLGYPGRHGRGVGHLRLILQPVLPQKLADAEQQLLLQLEKSMLENLAELAPELAAWEHKVKARRSMY